MLYLLHVKSCEECPFSRENEEGEMDSCSISVEVTEALETESLQNKIHSICPLRKCPINISVDLSLD